ncbi:calcium-binding protein [Streptomyces sp. NPDC002306]
MRRRVTAAAATAAAFSAVLAAAAFAVPAAGADQNSDTEFWNFDVNQVRDHTVGVDAARKRVFMVGATVTDPSGVQSVSFELRHGEDPAKADGLMVGRAHCVKLNATTSECAALLTADPNVNLRSNSLAGLWFATPVAVDGDGNTTREDGPYLAYLKRNTYMSQTVASPQPVKKGKSLTVKAQMTVASWDKHKNVPLAGHQVLLQYRKGTTGPFVTLKKIKTDRNGWATATVKATADGAYRYDFAGTKLTLAAAGSADFVDVK